VGEAFAGPSSLPIRQDLTLKSPVVATVKHGERLEVLQTRRRFVQVRTAQGAVGWTDNRQLLTPEQMQGIRSFAEATSGLPSQGSATVFEQLNVHTEPSRTSPSFIQIPEAGSVQVIGHKLAPRTSVTPERPPALPKKPARIPKKGREKESRRVPPPPMPEPPKLPPNWQELSRPPVESDEAARARTGETAEALPPDPAKKPPVMEDWSLVRTRDNKVGWVLSRMLTMSIPDDVAQYAEGHRITSYFPLSDIPDEGQTRHAWLWTTINHGGEPFEFDGLRVFTWNTRRHRYETVYRERELRGFYPVEAHKAGNEKNASAAFSVVVDVDGQLIRKSYVFNGYRVSLTRKEPYAPQSVQIASGSPSAAPTGEKQSQSQPWYTGLGAKVRSWFR
jgi:hypothetical protein